MGGPSGFISIAPATLQARPSEQGGGAPLSRYETTPRKNTGTACYACRRRRSRCNGAQPCNSCLSHGTECIKDDKDDKRRKIVVNRKIELLESEQLLLDDLLAAVRAANPQQLNGLINLIRSHVTKDDLRAHIADSFAATSGSPISMDDSSQPVTYRRRRMLGRIQDLVNPIITVPAKPWTTVTDDDDLVSHLMSLWFTWAHQWWQWVDKMTFIAAMRAGNPESLICTPYLVNIILADACLLDTLTEDTEGPNAWLREQFYNEAKRGLEAEEGRVSFALVATLGLQWTYLNISGQDKLGNPILYQQIYLAKDLEKWRSRMQQNSYLTEQVLSEIDRNLDRLLWTLFALSSLTLINLERTQPVMPPNRPKPIPEHEAPEESQTWQPYPQPSHPFVFHAECHFHAFLSLSEKVMRDEALFTGNNQSDSDMKRFREVYRELEVWPQNLLDCMKLGPRATPHVLALHGLHKWIMLILSKQVAAFDAGQPNKPTIANTPPSSEHAHWQEVCIASSIDISKLQERHRIEWGNDQFPVIVMRPVSLAPIALLEGLAQRPQSQDAMVELCIAITAASRRFRVGRGIMETISSAARRENVQLPAPCYHMIDVVTRSSEKSRSAPSAHLPSSGVDHLLKKWDDLDLN